MTNAASKPRFSFGLYGAGLGAMADRGATRIAQLAESLGYESLWTGEHMVIPDPQAPPSHRAPTHPFFDPIVALTYLAGATSRIRLATGILLIPQRHPVQLAKELTSLDILSGGRLMAGVGIGYVEDEMRAVGVDPRTRGAQANEHIAVLLELWRSEKPSFDGRWVQFDGVDAWPRPLTPGGPPLILGGKSQRALERTGKYANGWFGNALTPAQLREFIVRIGECAVAAGRSPDDIEITVSPASDRGGTQSATPVTGELLREYADAGASRVILNGEGRDLDEVAAVIEANQPARWADDLDGYEVIYR